MRTFLSVLFVSVLVFRLSATEQIHVITPPSLQDWRVTGTDKNTLVSSPKLTLPAGSQISREFTGGAVILHLKTSPVFSESPEDWPIVNVGPAALALTKNHGTGQLILVVDDSTTKEIPWPVKFEDDSAVMDLFLAYDPISGTGLLALNQQKKIFNLPRSAKPVEIWLSAGAQSAWEQQSMDVLILSEDTADGSHGRSHANSEPERRAGKLGSALDRLRNGTGFGEAGQGIRASAETPPTSGPSGSTLEVFTPPSVRRARIVEAVRAVTERGNNK